MKHGKLTILIVLTLAAAILSGVFLTACGKETVPKVQKIQIIDGSFKESYALDEEINYDGIYLLATYENGTTGTVKVQPEWISGLDVRTTGLNKTLTVTYGGASATFLYSVTYKMTVSTQVRLIATPGEENGSRTLTLSIANATLMPVYALKIDLSFNGPVYVSRTDTLPEGWACSAGVDTKSVTLLYYGVSGRSAFPADLVLTKVFFTGGSGKTVSMSLTVSDGEADRKGPDVTVTLL